MTESQELSVFPTLVLAAACSNFCDSLGGCCCCCGLLLSLQAAHRLPSACHVLTFGLPPAGRMLWPPPESIRAPPGWDGAALGLLCLGVSLSLAKCTAQGWCLSEVAGDELKKKCHLEGTGFWMIIFRFVQCLSWAVMNPSGVTATADWFFSGQPRLLKGNEEDLNSSSGLLCRGE